MKRSAALAALALAVALPGTAVASAGGRPHGCAAQRWVGAWAASPSDASTALTTAGTNVEDVVDLSGRPKPRLHDQTVRALLTPTASGRTVRVRLSNRFAASPVTFGAVTIGRQSVGASLSGPSTPLTFSGRLQTTLPAGSEVVSDPVRFPVTALQHVAVSMHVSNDPGSPTEHYTARQTSYLTSPLSGDHTRDATGEQFVLTTTTRPYVSGLDVLAPGSTGSVVAFGDSLTDGFQGPPSQLPEDQPTLDVDGRWPDDLARRLLAAHLPLTVQNAGISGNLVLHDASTDAFGVPALQRLDRDVLGLPGRTTVIWLEGSNDLGSGKTTDAASLQAGYVEGIDRMHAAGLRVVMATLPPMGSARGLVAAYGTASVEALRQQVNAWVRSAADPADAVVDFDAAVRDPSDPSQLDPAYDGGDGLHLNLAGYRAMAERVDLAQLRPAACGRDGAR